MSFPGFSFWLLLVSCGFGGPRFPCGFLFFKGRIRIAVFGCGSGAPLGFPENSYPLARGFGGVSENSFRSLATSICLRIVYYYYYYYKVFPLLVLKGIDNYSSFECTTVMRNLLDGGHGKLRVGLPLLNGDARPFSVNNLDSPCPPHNPVDSKTSKSRNKGISGRHGNRLQVILSVGASASMSLPMRKQH